MLLLRSFAFIIDGMIVLIPSSMLCYILNLPSNLIVFLPQIVFVMYNTICISSFEGKTVGKFFSKIVVYTESRNILSVGMRELSKLLYFLPIVGWLFLASSIVCILFTKKTLHDLLGQSMVGFVSMKRGDDVL